jgi:hypothetical protein
VHFVFTGFQQSKNSRQFGFERIEDDRTRSAYVVVADLTLLRKYAIGLQDAPLLCLQLLKDAADPQVERRFTFTEDDMRKYATDRATAKEAAALKAKHRRFPKPNGTMGRV